MATKRIDAASAQKDASRRRLLAAGVRLIEKGHYRPSRQEVADEVGMHRRSFHEHFGTIENYMAAILETFPDEVAHAINRDVKERGVMLGRLVLLGKRK